MAFTVNHIEIDGSINIDGSIFQWNQPFVGGGGGGGTGDVAWGSGNVGSDNQIITALGDGSIYAESNLTFDGTGLKINGLHLSKSTTRPSLLDVSSGGFTGIAFKYNDGDISSNYSFFTNGYFLSLMDDKYGDLILTYEPNKGITNYYNSTSKFSTESYGIRVAGDVSISGSMIVDSSSQYYYLGNPAQNGSWRWYIEVATGDLIFEKRVGGTWTYKSKIS